MARNPVLAVALFFTDSVFSTAVTVNLKSAISASTKLPPPDDSILTEAAALLETASIASVTKVVGVATIITVDPSAKLNGLIAAKTSVRSASNAAPVKSDPAPDPKPVDPNPVPDPSPTPADPISDSNTKIGT